MALFEEDNMNLTDDDANELVDSDYFYCGMTDCEEDYSEESKSPSNGRELSNMYGRFHFRTVAYQKALDSELEFPANIKWKEEMEIKDLVKNCVLPYLPAKSLVRFRTVSKEWDQWISSPFLAHMQSQCFRDISGFFRQYSGNPTFITLDRSAYWIPSPSLGFLPEAVVIRSSCNGLLLCQGRDGENMYYICNPANKEWEVLPRPEYYHGDEPKIVLVFEPSRLNFEARYQVICFVPVEPIIYFEIYSSETRSWKCSAADCVELGNSKLKGNGFYMKGVAYWETWSGELLAFDLKNEFCGIHPLPHERTTRGVLSQMDGELCYIQARYQAGNACIVDVYGGIHMCLKHSIEVDLQTESGETGDCQLLPCVNSDILTILSGGVVYSYHVRDQRVEVISRAGNGSRARYIPYVNSLVSLARN